MKIETQFAEISLLIAHAKQKAALQVNASLIELYWNIGQKIHTKVLNNEWGKSVVVELAKFIKISEPNIQGFSDRNIWRMKQFYETYSNPEFLKLSAVLAELPSTNNKGKEMLLPLTTEIQSTENIILKKLPTVLAEISWSLHLEIIACKSNEEKLFYLIKAKQERWSFRELKRQIATATFERTMLANEKIEQSNLSASFNLKDIFRDTYVLEFLSLQALHNENELQKAIVTNIKNFILEFGRDFAFMGEEYRMQVGNQDFFIDLLFYHRGLQCLVAIELKTERFAPEHLAQINFYLEALDRDVKNQKENPSIGILLCKGKDDVVVEYALSRTLNPALVADYQLALPDKKLLHDKWQEILEMNEKGGEIK
jgi:predicted nuclease of restriction endonuclease-like (RecB) superfamily